MKGIWRTLSLTWKTRLILGGISAVSLLGMILSLGLFREVYDRFSTIVRTNNRMELLVNQVSDRLHTASREEYAYMVSRKDEMLERRAKAFIAINGFLASVQAMQQDMIPRDKLQVFAHNVQAYEDEFKVIVQRLNTEGSLQDGLINDLRRYNNDIENIIKSNASPDQGQTMTLYLNVRRQRTDYMASRNPEFLVKAAAELDTFHQFLESAHGFTEEQKQGLVNASRSYVETLGKVDVNYQDMMVHRDNQEKLLTGIEDFIEELSGKLSAYNAQQLDVLDRMTRWASILFAVALVISGLLIGMASIEFTRLTERLTHIANDIQSAVSSALKTARTLNKSANHSLKDARRQATQIEKTTQTLQGVAQSVLSNVNHARDSLKNADETVGISNRGRSSVQQMRQTIKDIESAIQQMLAQSHESNQQMAGITQIISKISERTHVIDDIVFQTKLLSFNASVEAARAGEHGRGFAVVAEEVGALAQLSGKAAREISALLQSSQGEVLAIIKNSQEQMGLLMEASRNRVNQGVVVADNCSTMLGEIVEHVTRLRDTMNQICRLAEEESTDVQSISQTMLDVQSIASAQAQSADQVTGTAEEVNAEAAQLKASVNLLSNIVFGRRQQAARPAPKKKAPPPESETEDIEPLAS